MRKHLAFIFLVISYLTQAQINYNEKEILHTTNFNVSKLKTIKDINNDGFPELFFIGEIPIYFNNSFGDLNYSKRTVFDWNNFNLIKDYVLVDIDNDGYLDMVVYDYFKFYWFRNLEGEGFGGLAPLSGVSSPENISNLKVFDYDGDGFEDLVILTINGKLHIAINKQDGSFAPPTKINIAPAINTTFFESFTLFDFNYDGHTDILIRSSYSDYFILINDGNDYFNFKIPVFISEQHTALSYFNYDNNHLMDFIVTDKLGLRLITSFYDEVEDKFYFEDEEIYFFGHDVSSSGSPKIVIFDINQDGLDDVIVSTFISETYAVYYFEQQTDGTFKESILKNNLHLISSISVADLDGDGNHEILVTDEYLETYHYNYIINTIYSFKQSDNGFEETIIDALPFNSSNILTFSDINNDDHVDILNGERSLSWFENRGDNDWSGKRVIPFFSESTISHEYYMTDMDNDGIDDIIVVYKAIYQQTNIKDYLKVFKNLGNLQFEEIYSLNQVARNLKIVKNNENEYPDIYFENENFYEPRLYYIKNNHGVLEDPVECSFTNDDFNISYRSTFAMEDLNNDGLHDFINLELGIQDIRKLAYYQNLGNQEFKKTTLVSSTSKLRPNFVYIDDVNLDGKPDIFYYSQTKDQVNQGEFTLLINEDFDNRQFQTIVLETEVGISDMLLYDINEDGLPDMITLRGYNESDMHAKLYYSLNNGNGFDPMIQFGEIKLYSDYITHEAYGKIALFDKNEDGKLDIIVSTTGHHGEIAVFYNNSYLEVIDQSTTQQKTIVYPNPFSNYISWKTQESLPKEFQVRVFDLTGKTIFKSRVTDNYINLDFLPKGTFILNINDDSFKVIKK